MFDEFLRKPVMEELTTQELCTDTFAAIARVTADHKRRMVAYRVKTVAVGVLVWVVLGIFGLGLGNLAGLGR
jgi:hypothetical protein